MSNVYTYEVKVKVHVIADDEDQALEALQQGRGHMESKEETVIATMSLSKNADSQGW